MTMQIQPTAIPDVLLVQPDIFSDKRGYFLEIFRDTRYSEAGLAKSFVQENLAGSHQGTLRGLHYQIKNPQGKLVQAIVGEIFDVAVDLREKSQTFGKWVGVHLDAERKQQIWVPPGFAHGYYVLSEWSEVIYKTTDYYAPQWERTLAWDDKDIGIEWPLLHASHPTISPKDALGEKFSDCEKYPVRE